MFEGEKFGFLFQNESSPAVATFWLTHGHMGLSTGSGSNRLRPRTPARNTYRGIRQNGRIKTLQTLPTHSSVLGAAAFVALATASSAADAPYLYGLHWYGNPDFSQIATVRPRGDAEQMLGDRPAWMLEINHIDDNSPAGQANAWDRPDYYNWYGSNGGADGYGHAVAVGSGTPKGHSLILRLQPNWGRNVPFSDGPGGLPDDPYTTALFAEDARSAANWYRNYCRIWQIGNEVNLTGPAGENMRWNGSNAYDIPWTPTPEQYAAVYIPVRDRIHEITPNTIPARQVVLMQPVSPGNAVGDRYMDGNEFLWRQIRAVPTPAKIDGFALHAYAEPGGSNFGVDGFMDAIREQLMIIAELGLNDRPVFITEFNKHMPTPADAAIGARFVQGAYAAMHQWNTGVGGMLPGMPNHQIVGACWFVFRNDPGIWKDYSIQYQKLLIGGTNPQTNPWYGFQAAAAQGYPAGSFAGGSVQPSRTALWWQDDFAGPNLDTTPGLPHWRIDSEGSAGAVSMTGAGQARLRGSGNFDQARIRTTGYVFGNFRAEANLVVTDAARSGTATTEANFDLRIREGSQGYTLSFFTTGTDPSDPRRNKVVLRRKAVWTGIGDFEATIPGGINSGDAFQVVVVADGPALRYRIHKTAGVGANRTDPVVDWVVGNAEYNVGWISVGTYNLRELQVDRVAVGGPDWQGGTVAPGDWMIF